MPKIKPATPMIQGYAFAEVCITNTQEIHLKHLSNSTKVDHAIFLAKKSTQYA